MSDYGPFGFQRAVLETLEQQVVDNKEYASRAVLWGPSGCGKSWVVRRVAQKWEKAGGVAVIAAGEPALTRRSYGAFWASISAVGPRLSLERTIAKGASAVGRTVPVVGHLVAFLTDLLAENRSRIRRDQLLHLRTEEFDILCHLQAVEKGGGLLILADDLQYWDPDSLQLLFLIIAGACHDVFPFLKTARFLVSVTEDQGGQLSSPVSEILGKLPKPIRLHSMPAYELSAVLRSFGYTPVLNRQQLETLYVISGGHLELLRQLAMYLKTNPNCADVDVLLRTTGISGDRFLASILVKRLQAGGDTGRAVLTVLAAAAVIGKSFARDELSCLMKSTGIEPFRCIQTARELGLLATSGDGFTFRHDVLRRCLIQHLDAHAMETHRTFAECLTLLRPSDYFSRADQLAAAGLPQDSARLFFCGVYKRLRDGNPTPGALREQALQMLRATDQNTGAEAILIAHERILERRFSQAIQLLSGSENTDHPVFITERLLLLGLATLQSVTTSERRKALSILQDCLAIQHGERELEMRIKLTLLTAYGHLELWDEARNLDIEISAMLVSLRRTDPGAREALEIQRRKSAMLYGSEVAAERCRSAANFFGPPNGAEWPPRNPVQFFMAQCNLAGNLLVAGRFDEADRIASGALTVWLRMRGIKMPRVEKCINNSVVAGFLSGRLGANEAVSLLNELRAQNPDGVFSRLIRSNCAVFLAIGGHPAAAFDEFNSLSSELEQNGVEDEFYRYFIRSNLAGLLHVRGATERGWELWCSLDDHVPHIPDSDRAYLLARQKHQVGAFDAVEPGDVTAWNNYLQRQMPQHLGPGWRFYGRGLLLTDTQIWLES
jgi:hypothetical protein